LLLALSFCSSYSSSRALSLSNVSVLGYLPVMNPRSASWYLSHYAHDFSAFYYEGVLVGDLKLISQINELAAAYPNVTFMIELVIPNSVDLYNSTQLLLAERELDESLLALNQSNERYVAIDAMNMGTWGLDWSTPTAAEVDSWDSWLSENGFPKIPFAPLGTVYEPLFMQWAVNSAANLSARVLAFAREVRPELKYGLCQYDSIALSLNSTYSLYTFASKVHPDFIITMNFALAVPMPGFTSYPYEFVLLTVPMDPEYYSSIHAKLLVSDSLAGLTESSGDTPAMGLYKFALNELSTYLSGATPIVNMVFVDPYGNLVYNQEFVLDPALQVNYLPQVSMLTQPVLVIRPTYSLGILNWTAYYQQQLFYSLTRLGIPFNYVSEAYVYANPSLLQKYKYVIYCSTQITPQMLHILSSDTFSEKIGLQQVIPGYIHSSLPTNYSSAQAFNSLVPNFSLNVTSNLLGGRETNYYTIYFGGNNLTWGTQKIFNQLYLNGQKINVSETDYLGLYNWLVVMNKLAYVAGGIVIVVILVSLRLERRRRKKLERILEQ
jgi:hypothetical protein